MIHTRISIIVRMAPGLTDLTACEVIAGFLEVSAGFCIDIIAGVMAGSRTTTGLMRVIITTINTRFNSGLEAYTTTSS